MKTKLLLAIILLLVAKLSFAQNPDSSTEASQTTLQPELTRSDSLENRLKAYPREDTVRLNIIKELCLTYVDRDNDKLAVHATTMLDLSKKLNAIKWQADAFNFLGIVEDINSSYAKAAAYYTQALELAKQTDTKKSIASINNNIGLIEWKLGNLKEALTYFFDALKLAEEFSSIRLQANISSNIGLVFQDLKRNTEALSWQQKALALRLKNDDDYGLASTYTNLSSAYSYLNQSDSAILFLEKAIGLQLKMEDEYSLGISYLNLGSEYKIRKDFPQALKYYSLSKDIREANSDSLGLSFTYMSIANLHKEQRNYKEALSYGERALDISKRINSDERIAENSKSMSDIYRQSGQLEKAMDLQQQYVTYHEKVFNQEMTDKISELGIKYETEKNEKELAKANLQLIELELDSRQKNSWLLILGIVVLISLAAFRNYSIKSRFSQKQLALENELLKEQTLSKIQEQRLEISRDLHDSLGAQLTFINSVLDSLKTKISTLDEGVSSKINTLSGFSENSVAELKNTLWVLNSDAIFLEDLRLKMLNFISNAAEASESTKFNFHFEVKDNVQTESKFTSNLFRVFQEVINNALKHSHAAEITVEIKQTAKTLLMSIRDNGRGFDFDAQKNKSFGLANIQNRISAINGTLDIQTALGQGTTYVIETSL